LQQSRDAENDTVIKAMPVTGRYTIEVDSASAPVTDLQVANDINPEKRSNPNPRLNSSSPSVPQGDGGGQAVKPKPKPMKEKKPKAVMPKKPVEETNGVHN
jgi:hypothetical protein